MKTLEFKVTGMTCSHCELSVNEEVLGVLGVSEVAVSAKKGTLTVTAGSDVDTQAIISAVAEAGYKAEKH